jgi:hypothetical protein
MYLEQMLFLEKLKCVRTANDSSLFYPKKMQICYKNILTLNKKIDIVLLGVRIIYSIMKL